MIAIRAEQKEDVPHVQRVNELAFAQPTEADIVDRLRRACADSFSLVAEDDGIVGHILFTPAVIESPGRRVAGMGLAPISIRDRARPSAVLPAVRVRTCLPASHCLPMGRCAR